MVQTSSDWSLCLTEELRIYRRLHLNSHKFPNAMYIEWTERSSTAMWPPGVGFTTKRNHIYFCLFAYVYICLLNRGLMNET